MSQTANDERAEALARFGFLAIAGADRAVRQALSAVGCSGQQPCGAAAGTNISERRATYLALSKLDDRMLKDIGLTRADIEGGPADVAAGPGRGRGAPPQPHGRPPRFMS